MSKESTLDELRTVRLLFRHFPRRVQRVGSFPQLSDGDIPLEEEQQGRDTGCRWGKAVVHVLRVTQSLTGTPHWTQNRGGQTAGTRSVFGRGKHTCKLENVPNFPQQPAHKGDRGLQTHCCYKQLPKTSWFWREMFVCTYGWKEWHNKPTRGHRQIQQSHHMYD